MANSLTKPLARLPRNVKLLGWASFWNDVASEMVVPLLPGFIASLGGGKQALGWIEGAADATGSLLKLFTGAWSDRLQKRQGIIAFGYALPALLRPLLSMATAWWHVFGIRVGDRIGKGIRTSARDAMIADSTPVQQRGYAFGFHRAMDHLGAAIGPLLAMSLVFLFPEQLRMLFLLTVIPGLVVTGIVFFGLKDERHGEAAKMPFRFQVKAIGRQFWFYLVAVGIFTLGNASDLFLLARLSELGIPQWILPLLWCIFHLFKSLGNLVVGHLTDRWSARWLLISGWLLYATLYLALSYTESLWLSVCLFMMYAAYYALTEPPEKALVVQLVPDEHRGQAFGWFHFVTGIAVLPASVLFGWLYEHFGAALAFQTGAVLAFIATIMLFIQPSGNREPH